MMAGSHIDSVGTAGAFDGCLGCSAPGSGSFLNDAGITSRRPLVIAAWTEEEGVRFGTDMLGSAVAAGRLSLNYAYDLTDANGLRFGDELVRIGFKGSGLSTWPRRMPMWSATSNRGRCCCAKTTRSAWSPVSRRSRGRRSPCTAVPRTRAPRPPSCASMRALPQPRSWSRSARWSIPARTVACEPPSDTSPPHRGCPAWCRIGPN